MRGVYDLTATLADLKALSLQIGASTIKYGSFLHAAFDFFVVALVVFLLVRAYEKARGPVLKLE